MYSREQIQRLHRSLQELFPTTPVLLGGSYLYNEAGEESDVDFYVVCSSRQYAGFLARRRQLQQQKSSLSTIRFSVLFVPRFFFNRGWYYVYGQDIQGKIWASAINRSVLVRQTVKMAYFYYLNFVASSRGTVSFLTKAAQQLLVAWRVANGVGKQPFFTLASLSADEVENPVFCSLKHMADRQKNNPEGVFDIEAAENDFLLALAGIMPAVKHYFRFSLVNYCWYNMWFLLRGQGKFLARNPDKYIVQYMQVALVDKSLRPGVLSTVKEMVLLVFII